MTTLLTTAYCGPIAYYQALVKAHGVMLEQYETYAKQTYRNRCVIASANGPLALSIPVVRTGQKQLTRDVRIDNDRQWQHQHWHALKSAYRTSPFYQYLADDLYPYYSKHYQYLLDFNMQLLEWTQHILRIPTPVALTTAYQIEGDFLDLRDAFSPKSATQPATAPYYQVFVAKNGFLPNMSILDLIFNLGPEAEAVLIPQ